MFFNYEMETNKTLSLIMESVSELNKLFRNHQTRIFDLEKKGLEQKMEIHALRMEVMRLTNAEFVNHNSFI